VSGNNLEKLAARWQQDAIDLSPDLLSLLIGVNNRIASQDGTGEPPHTEVLDCYRSLLHQVHERHPNTRFLLLEPYLLQAGNVTPAMMATLKLIQQGMATVAAEFGAPFVPLQEVFNKALSFAPPSYWAYDGIHATHAGFQLIADAWLQAAHANGLLVPAS
jgi:lysophospholipase L1-like esterase